MEDYNSITKEFEIYEPILNYFIENPSKVEVCDSFIETIVERLIDLCEDEDEIAGNLLENFLTKSKYEYV
jgi:hypothetical protein